MSFIKKIVIASVFFTAFAVGFAYLDIRGTQTGPDKAGGTQYGSQTSIPWNFICGFGADRAVAANETIDISGVIEFKKINLSFKNPGKITELAFDEGIKVKKGEVLARLDISEMASQKVRMENALAYSNSLVPQIEAGIEFQKANRQSQLMAANASLAAARSRLEEAQAGNRLQQIEQAKAALAKSQVEYEKIESDFRRYTELNKSGSTSKQALETVRAQYLAAGQQLASAKEQYDLLKEGARKETIEQMKAGVEQAKAQVLGAEALEFQIKKSLSELESVKKDLEVKKSDIETMNIKIADSTLSAPEDGMILEKFSETSEVVGTASPVGVLANMKDAWVRGYIPEEDLGKVKIGHKVEVISDSYPDKKYAGYVAYISPEAEFTPKNVQTKRERVKLVYRVKINVDNAAGELKLGMPVDAKIKAGE